KDLSGNIVIHTLPPRLIWRVIATRAASICRLVIQHGSSDSRPYSPKCSELPLCARPFMRPRCTLRCLTRLGINIGYAPSVVSGDSGVAAGSVAAAASGAGVGSGVASSLGEL